MEAAFLQCEKAMKKMPTSTVLSSLKAYILVQLGKDQAGLELAQKIAKSEPIDRATLDFLEKVFVTINDCTYPCVAFLRTYNDQSVDQAAADIYEKAFNKTKNENLAVLYFFSLLKLQDPKKLFEVPILAYLTSPPYV